MKFSVDTLFAVPEGYHHCGWQVWIHTGAGKHRDYQQSSGCRGAIWVIYCRACYTDPQKTPASVLGHQSCFATPCKNAEKKMLFHSAPKLIP